MMKHQGKKAQDGRHPLYNLYLNFIVAAGAASLLFAVCEIASAPFDYRWVLLAALTAISSYLTIKIPGTDSKISIGDTFYFANLILFGTAPGIITAAFDAIMGSLRSRSRGPRLRYTLFNMGAMSISALAGGSVFFRIIGRGPLSQWNNPTPDALILPLGVLALVHYLMNSISVASIVALDSRRPIYKIWKEGFLWTSITYFVGAAAAGFIALRAGDLSPAIFCVAGGVIVALYYTYKIYMDKVEQLNKALTQVNTLAYHDALTSLPNRLLFTDHLEQALAEAGESRQRFGVIFLDLDRFKRINDTLGHGTGDQLLKAVAERLKASIAESERADDPQVAMYAGRFGGDEFAILVKNLQSDDQMMSIANRILHNLSMPLDLNGNEICPTGSIGISIYPTDGRTAEQLLQKADTAMYFAKGKGRAGFFFYSNHMDEKFLKDLSLENELRKAIDRNEFEVYYQPKIDAQTERVVGLEALARWHHPVRGLLAPAEFIPLAEETGLIIPVGEWVLRQVCKQRVAWRKSGIDLPIAVNLSGIQFQQKDLSEKIARILDETAMNPGDLELEVTESTLMNKEEAEKTLLEIASLGVRLSIDDFGTGYSSLSYLKQFTLDALKIDKSFIKDLSTDEDDRAITSAIIAMAHSLGLRVVAEGVESEQDLRFLRERGCDEVQGFMFSLPLPVAELEKYLRREQRRTVSRIKTWRSGQAANLVLIKGASVAAV